MSRLGGKLHVFAYMAIQLLGEVSNYLLIVNHINEVCPLRRLFGDIIGVIIVPEILD